MVTVLVTCYKGILSNIFQPLKMDSLAIYVADPSPGLHRPVEVGTSGASAAAAFLPLGPLRVATEPHGEVGSTEVGAGSAADAGRKGAPCWETDHVTGDLFYIVYTCAYIYTYMIYIWGCKDYKVSSK